MNQENLKNFEFNEYILRNISLFDEVLEECGESPLLENKNFATFLDFPISSNTLTLEYLQKTENTVSMIIWFGYNSLRIDIDGMSETFEWAKKHIDESPEKVVDIIRNLFTGYISIETRRSSRFVQMFDSNGFFDDSFSYNNLFHMITGRYLFRHKDFRRLYLPMFSKK